MKRSTDVLLILGLIGTLWLISSCGNPTGGGGGSSTTIVKLSVTISPGRERNC